MTNPAKYAKSILTNYYIYKVVKNDLESAEVRQSSIVLYMSGGIGSYYQFMQWAAPLRELNKEHKVVVVTRSAKLFVRMKKDNILPCVWLKTLNDLSLFYEQYKFPVILYVNNVMQNFQSLIYSQGYHIHLNHGESEKESMYSNQSKAYDYVFCVGDRAVQRYEEALLNFDASKYIKVGRPQLDFIEPFRVTKKEAQKVILYAPTWEGHHASMDYSSLAAYGIELVSALLANPEYFVLYKPHGNTGQRRKDILKAHKTILQILSKAPNGQTVSDMDINSVFTAVDFAFFDNSSVMIDYLHTDKPAFFFDIQEDPGLRFLSECFTPIKNENISAIMKQLREHLRNDPNGGKREKIKSFYLGNYSPMESTKMFINKISEIIRQRDKKAHANKQ